MRRASFLLVCAAMLAPALVGEFKLRHLNLRYLEAGAFKRISEYFTGRENPGSRLLCRSRPASRAGLYLILSLSERSRNLPEGATFLLEVIRPDSPEPKTFRIPVPAERPRGKEAYVGLTGEDWPDPEARPVAWRLRLLDSAGATLFDRKSFLWEKRPAPVAPKAEPSSVSIP